MTGWEAGHKSYLPGMLTESIASTFKLGCALVGIPNMAPITGISGQPASSLEA